MLGNHEWENTEGGRPESGSRWGEGDSLVVGCCRLSVVHVPAAAAAAAAAAGRPFVRPVIDCTIAKEQGGRECAAEIVPLGAEGRRAATDNKCSDRKRKQERNSTIPFKI